MNKVLTVISLLFSALVHGENCRVQYLEDLNYTDIECQFYMGTAAYRNEVFSVAAAHWKYLLDAPIKHSEDESIKATALGTLTFLTYEGLGVEENKELAVKNWKEAARRGDLEARRHLGRAYSDRNFRKRNLVVALAWYESILLIHSSDENLDDSESTVYKDAVEGANEIRAQLPKKLQADADELAESLI